MLYSQYVPCSQKDKISPLQDPIENIYDISYMQMDAKNIGVKRNAKHTYEKTNLGALHYDHGTM